MVTPIAARLLAAVGEARPLSRVARAVSARGRPRPDRQGGSDVRTPIGARYRLSLAGRIAVLACLSALAVAGSGSPSLALAEETTITVDSSRQLHPISPLLFGLNHRYAFNAYDSFDPRMERVEAVIRIE